MSTVNNNRNSKNGKKSRSRSSDRGRSSGSRTAKQARTSAAQRNRRNTRRSRPSTDYTKIAILGVVLILLIAGVAFTAKYIKGNSSDTPIGTAATTQEPESKLVKNVAVDGVNITGMSREDARAEILNHYKWQMTVNYEDSETPYELANLMETKIDALLDEIYMGQPKESYTLDATGLEEAVKAEVSALAGKWDVKPQNGAIAGFNKENGSFIYSGEKTGKLIDREALAADIQAALSAKQFDAVLTAKGTVTAPEITAAQAKEMYRVIGAMSTTTTSNKDRNTNIRLAAEALNGLIVQPGEEFSFNKTTGNRTLERGYKPAGAYVNGVLVEEPGGGVCQVSSTMYNAVVFAGLNTTERHPHSYEPSYVTPGEDAMVSYDGYAGPDMRFVNNSQYAVAIRASFSDLKLTISVVGIPILQSGETWKMKSEKVADLDPPEPVYEENQTLEPGVEKIVKQAVNGSRWYTNLVKTKDGVVVSDELFHKSTYKGKAATIQRNTSGVVIAPTTSPDDTTVEPVTEPVTPSTDMPANPPGGYQEPGGPGDNPEVPQTSSPAPGNGPSSQLSPTQEQTPEPTPATDINTEAPKGSTTHPGASAGPDDHISPNPFY